MSNALKPVPPALPATADQWVRDIKSVRTINDWVEDIHLLLLNSDKPEERERYNSLLYAVYDEQAVEGSMSCDNCLAAELIREKAIEVNPNHPVAREKLATIWKALNVVLHRYHQSRKERRNMIHGEHVSTSQGHPNDQD